MFTSTTRKLAAAALAAATALSLTACGGGAADEGGSAAEGTADKTITLGFIPSWTDGLSTAYLLAHKLESLGYEVEMEELNEPGPLYVGLSEGDIDIYPSAWSEVTHADFMNKYGDKIEDLGTYYDNAKLTWAVPSYSKMNSIADIEANADVLDKKIIGIEPGAGLTKASLNSVLPGYGLDKAGFEVVTSSTPAMLTELKKATEKNEEIVVTLWQPFWANSTFDMKTLEDPKGALGEGEGLHFLATKGFGEKYPDVAEWIGSLKLDDATYGSLEDTVVNKFGGGQEAEAIIAWVSENGDKVGIK